MPRKRKSMDELEELFEEHELRKIGNYMELREDKTEFDLIMYGNEGNEKDFLLNIEQYDEDLYQKIKMLSVPECKNLISLVKEDYYSERFFEDE